ncbi:MAG: hypothetical protein IJC59_00555 [Lachnospiraceae bacterium]|nr:hypothetical protein [Lachnospiraceae bacterium]
MMHAMMDEAHTAGMVGMTNGGVKDTDYEFPSWFTEGTAQTLSGGYAADNNWVVNGLGIRTGTTEAQIQQILADPAHSLNSGSTSSQYGTGYLAVMYLGHLASGGGNTIDGGSIAAGLDALMNDIRGGKSLSQAISERIGYADIADFEASFAADAAGFVRRLSQAVGAGSGSLIPGMLTKQDVIDATLQDASLSRLFHLDSSTVYVKNTYPANYPVMTGGLADIAGVRGPDYRPSGNLRDEEWMAAMGGPRSSRRELTLHIGADSAMDNAVTLRIEAMNSRTLGITGLDIRTVEEATRSIDTIADALQKVSRQRSAIGAYQNRLEHTVANLDNVVENTTASESRIRDTDMAGTMVGYTNHQIVLQAAQAMLAQSSKSNQGVLTLIGG